MLTAGTGFQPADQILLQQGKEHDAGASSISSHAVELLLAAYQRIDMFDRRHVGILRSDRARHRDQRLAVESEIGEDENNCRS